MTDSHVYGWFYRDGSVEQSVLEFTVWYFVILGTVNFGPGGEVVYAAACASQDECADAVRDITPRLTTLDGVEIKTFCSQDPKYREVSFPSIAALKQKFGGARVNVKMG